VAVFLYDQPTRSGPYPVDTPESSANLGGQKPQNKKNTTP